MTASRKRGRPASFDVASDVDGEAQARQPHADPGTDEARVDVLAGRRKRARRNDAADTAVSPVRRRTRAASARTAEAASPRRSALSTAASPIAKGRGSPRKQPASAPVTPRRTSPRKKGSAAVAASSPTPAATSPARLAQLQQCRDACRTLLSHGTEELSDHQTPGTRLLLLLQAGVRDAEEAMRDGQLTRVSAEVDARHKRACLQLELVLQKLRKGGVPVEVDSTMLREEMAVHFHLARLYRLAWHRERQRCTLGFAAKHIDKAVRWTQGSRS